MKAVFEIRTIESDWKPPFDKKATSYEIAVKKGETFDWIFGNGNNEPVFKLLDLNSGKVEVQYSKLFTLKNYKHQREKSIWLDKGNEETLTYLWGEKGITKKIRLMDISEEMENGIQASDSG